MKKTFLALLLLIALPGLAFAQPMTAITPTTDATALENALFGPGITVLDVQFTGDERAIGTFIDGPLGMEGGVAMSTGLVEELAYQDPKTDPNTALGALGSSICETLTGSPITFDAAMLRVEFTISDGFALRPSLPMKTQTGLLYRQPRWMARTRGLSRRPMRPAIKPLPP